MIIDMLEIHQDWKTKEIKILCKPCVVTVETDKQIKVDDGFSLRTIRKKDLPKNLGYSTPKFLYERGTKQAVLEALNYIYEGRLQSTIIKLAEEQEILAQVTSMLGEYNIQCLR